MSNRQQRRSRRAGSPHTVTLPPGVAMRAEILTSTGETKLVDNFAPMPAKREGVHRWQAYIVHSLTDDQAAALARGDRILFDGSNVVSPPLTGCVDCEQPYPLVVGKPCPAGDEWREE